MIVLELNVKAAEFSTTANSKGQIELPSELSLEIPAGKSVQVVLLWEAAPADDSWRLAGRESFQRAYCPEDAIYESLVTDDAHSR